MFLIFEFIVEIYMSLNLGTNESKIKDKED